MIALILLTLAIFELPSLSEGMYRIFAAGQCFLISYELFSIRLASFDLTRDMQRIYEFKFKDYESHTTIFIIYIPLLFFYIHI